MEGTCTFLSCPPGASGVPTSEKAAYSHLKVLNAKHKERRKMPSKKLRLTVYLSPEEHAAITASASRAGISLSTFAKRVCTGMAVPSLEHRQAVKDMLKANADLARLGGLFKLALSEKPEGHDRFILQKLLRDIEASQRELKAAIARVR